MAHKDHIADVVSDNCIRMWSRIIKELFNFTHAVFCRLYLLRGDGDGAKGGEHSGIHIPCVVEQTLMTSWTNFWSDGLSGKEVSKFSTYWALAPYTFLTWG